MSAHAILARVYFRTESQCASSAISSAESLPPNAGIWASGFTAFGFVICAVDLRFSQLLTDVRELGPFLAADPIDHVAAHARLVEQHATLVSAGDVAGGCDACSFDSAARIAACLAVVAVGRRAQARRDHLRIGDVRLQPVGRPREMRGENRRRDAVRLVARRAAIRLRSARRRRARARSTPGPTRGTASRAPIVRQRHDRRREEPERQHDPRRARQWRVAAAIDPRQEQQQRDRDARNDDRADHLELAGKVLDQLKQPQEVPLRPRDVVARRRIGRRLERGAPCRATPGTRSRAPCRRSPADRAAPDSENTAWRTPSCARTGPDMPSRDRSVRCTSTSASSATGSTSTCTAYQRVSVSAPMSGPPRSMRGHLSPTTGVSFEMLIAHDRRPVRALIPGSS